MRSKPGLKPVTICAVDCVNAGLALRALRLSMRECGFGDAILFSDCIEHDDVRHDNIRVERIRPLHSRAGYSRFILRDLKKYIETPFVLIVQWDGYVLDAGAWTGQFLEFDYIGAVWPWFPDRKVGNGGFSLRSKRLLEATAVMPAGLPEEIHEDHAICRDWRAELEARHGIKFAPEALANQFSYERLLPGVPTFGFHGMFNMWRHLDNDELVSLVAMLDERSVRGVDYLQCMLTCFFQRRFKPLAAFYGRLRQLCSIAEIGDMVRNVEAGPATIAAFLKISEAALRLQK